MTTWIKVYNSMPSHPKMLAAGDRAAWLFICGCCYSNEYLTDGFVPRHVLPVVAPGVRRPEHLAERLVLVGLWHEDEGGWRIHDYSEHQRSAEEVRERRAADAQRKAEVRQRRANARNVRADSSRNPERVRALDVDVEVDNRGSKATHSSSATKLADEKITDDDRRLCRLLVEQMRERNPKARVKSHARWLNDMRLLRERDDNAPDEIEQAIRWVFRDSFWGGVIQSPGNLRQHFPAIWDKMRQANGSNGRTGQRVETSDEFLARRGLT